MKKSELFFSVILVPMDCAMLLLASLSAYWIRFGEYAKAWRPIMFSLSLKTYLGYSLLVIPLCLLIFALTRLYVIYVTRRPADEFRRIFLACTAGITLVLLIDFARHELFSSRFIILAAWLLSIIFVSLGRALVHLLQRQLLKKGIGVHRVLIIDCDKASLALIEYFKHNPGSGYKVVGVVEDFSPANQEKILARLKQGEFDEIIAGSPRLSQAELQELFHFSYEHNLPLKYLANLFETELPNLEISVWSGIPLVEVKKTRLDGWGRVWKRFFDLMVAFLLLLIFSPLMIITAILIKLDSVGPVFFSYQRIGQFGRPFRYFKFRSMRNNTHQLRYDSQFMSQQVNLRSGTPMIKIKDDPRITRIGKFIRRFSVDELPEFFLVLSGKMSLVGPRPHEVEEVAKYNWRQRKVLNIKPGITGLAQISGRSDLNFEEEISLDTYYMEHWSLWQDVIILLKTPLAVLRSRQSE